MTQLSFNLKIKLAIVAIIGTILITLVMIWSPYKNLHQSALVLSAAQLTSISQKEPSENVLYKGEVLHIFFHSLVLYPELAFRNDAKGNVYRDNMVTKDQFKNILQLLYKNQYILIDIASLYKVNVDGTVEALPLYLPKGKKPLIISLDDLNYYDFMEGRGFADKLVLDKDGNVATEVITPQGDTLITRDGDVVPILDDFVHDHPDFSQNQAKGIIALTGFQGILGYRTQKATSTMTQRSVEITAVKDVVEKLKNTGWTFASHSYSHDHSYQNGSISLQSVKEDVLRWKEEVASIVGDTDIFIGPFGQTFTPHDPRRQYLISAGFKMMCGVGLDLYFHYFSDYVFMDRADIDGYRIKNNTEWLQAHGM